MSMVKFRMQSVFTLFGLIVCGLLLHTATSVEVPVRNEGYRATTVIHKQPCHSNSGHQTFVIESVPNQYKQQQTPQQVIQTNYYGHSNAGGAPQKLGSQAALPTSYQNAFLENSAGSPASSSAGYSYLAPIDHSAQYSGPEYLPPTLSTTGGHLQQQQPHHPQQNVHSHVSQVVRENSGQGSQSVNQYQPSFEGQQQQHQQQSFVHGGQQSQQRGIIQQQQYQEQGSVQQQGHQQHHEQVGVHQGHSQRHEFHQVLKQHVQQHHQQQQQHEFHQDLKQHVQQHHQQQQKQHQFQQQQQGHQQLQQHLAETTSYKGPDYLPPLIGSTEDRQQHSTPATTFSGPVGASKGSNQHFSLVNKFVQGEPRISDQRVNHISTQQQQQQQQHDQNISTAFGFISLPTGYEFDKPDEAHAKEAFLQLHSLQLEQQKQQQQQQQKQQQQQQQKQQQQQQNLEQQRPQLKVIHPDSYNNNHNSNIYKANSNNIVKTTTYGGFQPSVQANSHSAFVGQEHQQHLVVQQPSQQHSSQQRAPGRYSPPVETVSVSSQQQQHLHQQDLRSVTGGQPQAQYSDGYHSGAPVHAEYSPSVSNTAPLQVAPPATGPQQYTAPAPSYRPNSVPQTVATYTLKSSAIQTHNGDNRQSFNTNGINYQPQPQQQVAVAPPNGDTGKIRTVQILESKALKKTLKVLETADAAGVTTLKILGPSNEDPMGDHQVVRVVSSNGAGGSNNSGNNHQYDQQIQTVKIFNDHKVVKFDGLRSPAGAGRGGAVNNEYLPPTNSGRSNHHQRF